MQRAGERRGEETGAACGEDRRRGPHAEPVLRPVRRFEFSREHGLIDFDDMLDRVDRALSPENPNAPALLAALRARYRYAIVDEFQDTDRVQWSIFRKVFTGAGKQRLVLVGDPKQAIYGFRGA